MAKRGSQDRQLHLIASVIFGVVAFVHIIRLAGGLPLRLGDWMAPMWLSWVAVVALGYLAIKFWKTAH